MTARTAVLATLVVGALTASGCGGSRQAGPPVTSKRFGVGATGVVQFWDRNTTAPFGEAIVKKFNATHPHLKVVLSPVQDTQYVTKLATAIRSGSAPDLVGIDDINSQLFIYHDAFLDLTPAVRRLPYLNRLSAGQLRLTRKNGHYYGTPYVADLSMLWYNKALFRRAHLDPANPPDNYRKILADARAISRLGHGIYGISFAGRCEGCLGFTVLPDIWATRTHLLNGPPGHQTANIRHNVPLRRTLTLYHRLWAGHLAAPESRTETGVTWGQNFLSGKVGMLPAGYGTVIAAASPSLRKNLGAIPLPGPRGGPGSTFEGGANFGIPKNAKNPSGAWEFIKFALRQEQQVKAPTTGFSPVRTDVVNRAYRAKYPVDTMILHALRHGYVPKTLAYNVTFNQPGGPWLQMFTRAVFDGQVRAAIRAGQTGFGDALAQAGT